MDNTYMGSQVIRRAMRRPAAAEGDVYKAGLLYCGICGDAKEARLVIPTMEKAAETRIVPVTCKCAETRYEQEQIRTKQQQFRERVDTWWHQDGLTIRSFEKCSFAADDGSDAEVMAVCRRYVERWDVMRQENTGILLYGPVGTGKSFAAAAIANALLESGVSVCVTNFARLLNRLQNAGNRQDMLDRLDRYELLVIDDLGAERDSSYACEQVFNVIDARAQARLPLIVTTNLTLDELQNPDSWDKKRIYDRLLEMCPIRLKMAGESRRQKNAEVRKELARRLLLGKSTA